MLPRAKSEGSIRRRLLKCKVTNASVDYITCTSATKDAQRALWSVGERVLHRGESEGEHATRWHANGYDGWSNGRVTIAARKDGSMLRISGQQAQYEWLKCIAAAENCSRLDLAVDCELDNPVTTLTRQIYRDVRHVPPKNGRPPKRSLILSGDGGSTVYIGARSSEQFGRVYDKGRETKTLPVGRWWRWEVELKGRASWNYANLLSRSDDHRTLLCAMVNHWFLSRSTHGYTTSSIWPGVPQSVEKSSIEQKLSWLAQSVRPTVSLLVDRLGRDRVMHCLGLLPQSAVPPVVPQSTLEVA